MDNENKIKNKELVPQKTNLFFKDNSVKAAGKEELYSLKDEFHKTKKRKNFLFYLAILVFIGALITVTVLITTRIQTGTSEISIDISDFKSINLNEIFKTTKQNERDLRNAKQDLIDLKQDLDIEVTKIKDKSFYKINMITTKRITKDEQGKQIKAVKETEKKQITIITRLYNRRINKKRNEIKVINSKIKRQEKTIKKGQSLIDNFDKLRDLEEQKIHDKYQKRIRNLRKEHKKLVRTLKKEHRKFVDSLILKYNPMLDNDKLKDVLKDGRLSEKKSDITLNKYSSIFKDENVIKPDEYSNLERMIYNNVYIINWILDIPYINGVHPTLRKINFFNREVIKSYDSLWLSLVKVIKQKKSLIDKHRDALNYYSKLTKEHGYVVNAENSQNIVIVLNDNYPVTEGSEAYVIRGEKNKIATLKLFNHHEGIRAKVISVESSKRIKPLDKLLIKLK